MWPFSRNKISDSIPAICCGDINITWNTEFDWWQFSDGGIDYMLVENPVFDPSLLSKLQEVAQWLAKLDSQIDVEVKQHLEGWGDEAGEKQLVGIDVSWLIDKHQVDVSYANEAWADLGINIVITAG